MVNPRSKQKISNLALMSTMAIVMGWSCTASSIELGHGFGLDVTLTALSDYRDTGVSQSKGDPALQGDAMLWHDTGLYAGVFLSTIDTASSSSRETMYYGGLVVPFSEDVYLDLYYGRYEYPKEAYDNFNEAGVELSAYNLLLGYVYDHDFRGQVPDLWNAYIGYYFDLPFESQLFVRYGYTDLNMDALYSSDGSVRQTLSDWELTLSREFFSVKAFASYVDNDMSKTECYYATGYDDICSSAVVFGMSKTF